MGKINVNARGTDGYHRGVKCEEVSCYLHTVTEEKKHENSHESQTPNRDSNRVPPVVVKHVCLGLSVDICSNRRILIPYQN
jgi:hypothetical protein